MEDDDSVKKFIAKCLKLTTYGDRQVEISNKDIAELLSISDRRYNVVNLSKAILRAINGNTDLLYEFIPKPSSPFKDIEEGIKKERPDEGRVRAWALGDYAKNNEPLGLKDNHISRKMDNIQSNNRYVAHFDMLGFKSAIARNFDEAWGALRDLRASMDKILGMAIGSMSTDKVIADRIRAFIFSDSILIFTLSNKPEDLKAILILSSELFSGSLASCVPLRGGISLGKFYFDLEKHLFCGVPFVQAYEIAERAQWSGIVVHDSVAKNYFDDPSKPMSGEAHVLVQWDVPVKPSGQKKHWVINWPHIYKHSFNKPAPITTEDFYQAFESFFGSYEELKLDAKIKYENTVKFVNWVLGP